MTKKKADNPPQSTSKNVVPSTFHIDKEVIQALKEFINTRAERRIQSIIVTIGICDVLLANMDVHTQWKTMGMLADKRMNIQNEWTMLEAKARKKIKEKQDIVA